MIFEHYTPMPLTLDLDRVYEQPKDHFKPKGFWISVKGEDDWPSWCERENFGRTDYVSTVELQEDSNILVLSTVREILEFHEKYKVDLMPESEYDYWYIDWHKVIPLYDGIIIAPYQWELRLSMKVNWYYAWDVASGCIWNLNAIKSITPSITHIFEEKEIESVG